MNTRTFEVMDFDKMNKEIDEAKKAGREPDTYIPVGNETRQVRRAKERAAKKAMKKMAKRQGIQHND
jgi:hypothetical protein